MVTATILKRWNKNKHKDNFLNKKKKKYWNLREDSQ